MAFCGSSAGSRFQPLDPDERRQFDQGFQTAQLLGLALIGAIPFYAVVVWLIARQPVTEPASGRELFRSPVYALAFISAVSSLFVRCLLENRLRRLPGGKTRMPSPRD